MSVEVSAGDVTGDVGAFPCWRCGEHTPSLSLPHRAHCLTSPISIIMTRCPYQKCLHTPLSGARIVPRKFSIGGFAFLRLVLTFWKLTKTLLIYNVSCFNLGGLELCFGRISPPKPSVATGLSSTLQKCFQSSPALAEAGPVAEKLMILNATSEYRVCILVSLLNHSNFSTEYFI